MQLASPAWLEPDLCVIEEWEGFRKSLVQLITTGGGQRSTIICGLSDAARRTLERDLRLVQRDASPVHMLTRASDLKLEELPALLADRIANAPLDEPLGVCFFHDVAWAAERYGIEALVEYQQQMAALRRDYPIQMVHLYPPSAFDAKALWYCTRVHRAVWTGEAPCENFYYTPRPAPPASEGFSFEDDLKRTLGYLQRQARMRAELVGRVVETESMLEERVAELHALNRLARILAHSQDLEEILREALGRVIEMLGMEAGGIYVFSDEATRETRQRVLLPGEPFDDDALRAFHDAATLQSPGGRIWWTSDVSDSHDAFLPADSAVRSFLVAPLKFSGETVGLLEVVGSEAHAFSLQEIHLVDVIGGQIGVAVKNARLHEKQVQAETAEHTLRQQLRKVEGGSSGREVVDGLVERVEASITAAQASLAAAQDARGSSAAAPLAVVGAELARATHVLGEYRALEAESVGETLQEPCAVRLDATVQMCVEKCREALAAAGVEPRVQIDAGAAAIQGDPRALERLFVTLIEQAIGARAKTLVVTLAAEGRECVVTVEDDGSPFAPSDVAHAFEPFRAARGKHGAPGLALAICTRIVKRHGATIELQRAGDKTRFVIRFPMLPEQGQGARRKGAVARGVSDDLARSGKR